jgi:hypothetical protein
VTVIPVLYIALAVQGHSQDSLMRAAERATRSTRTSDKLTGLFLEVLAGLIVVLGGVAEITALAALYMRHNIAHFAPAILSAVIFLVAAVATGPIIRFVEFGIPEPRHRQTPAARARQDAASEAEHRPTPESQAALPSPHATQKSESGKTDAV